MEKEMVKEEKDLRDKLRILLKDKFNDKDNLNLTVNKILANCGVSAMDPVYVASRLREHGNYTLGVLLTAVEAALGDSKQAEALKAIVRREMYLMIDRNQAEHYESLQMQKHGLAPREIHIDGQDELR